MGGKIIFWIIAGMVAAAIARVFLSSMMTVSSLPTWFYLPMYALTQAASLISVGCMLMVVAVVLGAVD